MRRRCAWFQYRVLVLQDVTRLKSPALFAELSTSKLPDVGRHQNMRCRPTLTCRR